MASWQPKKLDLTKINSGARFNNGDGVNADDINAVVESSAFVQSLGENQPQLIEDGGATSVSIDTTNNKFVFKNIKGQKGDKGDKGIQGERGEGVPSGGTAGQVLTKTASGTAWEDAPSGGGGGKTFASIMSSSIAWDSGSSHPVYLLPRGFNNYKITAPEYGTVSLSKEQLELGGGEYQFSSDNYMEKLKVLGNSPYYDPANLANDYYAVGVWHSYMDGEYYNSIGTMLLVME